MNNSRSNFYTVVDFLKKLLQSDPIVNTVVFGKTEQTDIYKKNIFPIAHIIPVQSPWNGASISSFTFQIGVLEQRDINSVKKNDKFSDDNMVDNLNLTYAVLNNLLSYLENQNNPYYIELDSVGSIQPFLFVKENLLDGWYVTITLTIRNDNTCYGFGEDLYDDEETPIVPPTENTIPCDSPTRKYYSMSNKFTLLSNNSSVNINGLTSAEIINLWLDNANYGNGIGQLGMAKCVEGLKVGDNLYTTGFDLTLWPDGSDGYWIVDDNNEFFTYGVIQEGQLINITSRSAPLRTTTAPIDLTAVTPKIIKIESGVVTEIIQLPMTGFVYE